MHPLNIADHVVERGVVGEHEVFVDGKAKSVTDVGHDFGLLHRVNTQFTFEVLVEFNEICGVTRVFNDDRYDGRRHFGVVDHRCWCRC